MMQRWRLDGRRALVTGGTRGIGEAIARELLSLGARVTIVARTPEQVKQRVEAWRKEGLHAFGITADASKQYDREKIILPFALDEMGGLDILVNNAGTNRRGASVGYETGNYREVFRTNLTSVWEMCRLAYPYLKEGGHTDALGDSSIVTIGSVAGNVYIGSGAPYAMTKAALDELTKYLAVEWAGDGIRVNSVNPWYTATSLTKALLDNPEFTERVLARTPNRRVATPDDISGLTAFLCLPAARHITGQTIAVDGGFLANGSF